jgi:hypothetical protein
LNFGHLKLFRISCFEFPLFLGCLLSFNWKKGLNLGGQLLIGKMVDSHRLLSTTGTADPTPFTRSSDGFRFASLFSFYHSDSAEGTEQFTKATPYTTGLIDF